MATGPTSSPESTRSGYFGSWTSATPLLPRVRRSKSTTCGRSCAGSGSKASCQSSSVVTIRSPGRTLGDRRRLRPRRSGAHPLRRSCRHRQSLHGATRVARRPDVSPHHIGGHPRASVRPDRAAWLLAVPRRGGVDARAGHPIALHG